MADKKSVKFAFRMTERERKMLRTLGIRSPQGTDQGWLRSQIRKEFGRRAMRDALEENAATPTAESR